MFYSFFVILLHLLPSLLVIVLFFLVFDVSFKSAPVEKVSSDAEPDVDNLERKLQELIETNNLVLKKDDLSQALLHTPANIMAAYMNTDKKHLKGFHLFQLIFSLIKNGDEDGRIIKILHHHLPESPISHLVALLKSCKEFLRITKQDGHQKQLCSLLNKNQLKEVLIYLQTKINQTFNSVLYKPAALQQPIIDEAVIFGLIFASIAQFYNKKSTEKILRLAYLLSPELFLYWHQIPEKNENFAIKSHFSKWKKAPVLTR